jgi:DNA-binding response OmpR family regulator
VGDARTVVIVDDNPDMLEVLVTILEKGGYRALPANAGEFALDTISRIVPDLVILDILMPGIDGFAVLRRLKESPSTRDIPVIFISALGTLDEKLKGFRLGAVDFIPKPFSREEVLIRVNTQVEFRLLRLNLESRIAERTRELERMVVAKEETEERLQAALAERDLLLRELGHRTKNGLGPGADTPALRAQDRVQEKTKNLLN